MTVDRDWRLAAQVSAVALLILWQLYLAVFVNDDAYNVYRYAAPYGFDTFGAKAS